MIYRIAPGRPAVEACWTLSLCGMRIVFLLFLLMPVMRPVSAQERPPALEVQFYRAEAAWKAGASLHEAKARVDRVLEELPSDVEARKLRAQVLLALGRPADALTDALRAIDLAPADAEARLILCEAAIEADEPVLARREFEAAAERIVDDPIMNLRLSVAAMALGYRDRAEAFARTALALAPQNPHAHYQLARVFVSTGRRDDAAAVLEQGFQRATIDASIIREDSLLQRVADHPSLRRLVDP